MNPDDIQKEIEKYDFLDVRDYGVNTTEDEILPFFVNATMLRNH